MNLRAGAAWCADRVNPIVVKEVRQAIKSRQFAVLFMLLLTSCLVIVIVGGSATRLEEDETAMGLETFGALAIALLAASLVCIPMVAFHSLRTERADRTYDLLLATPLKPRQIVSGKLLASVAQMALYASAIAPFAAFAYFLRGIDAPTIAATFLFCAAFAIPMCVLSLFLASLARNRLTAPILQLLSLGAGVAAFCTLMAIASNSFFRGRVLFEFDDPDFWWGSGMALTFLATFSALLFAGASTQMAPSASNRSTGVRLALLSMYLAAGIWASAVPDLRTDDDVHVVFGAIGLILGAVAGLGMTAESEELSPRIRNTFPRRWFGPLYALFFYPGRGRAALFLVAMLGSHLGLCTYWIYAVKGGFADEAMILWYFLGYLFFYLGFPGFLADAILGKKSTPGARRAFVLLALAVGSLAPFLVALYVSPRRWGYEPPAILFVSPWSIFVGIRQSYWALPTFAISMGGIGLLCFLPSMLRAVRQTGALCRAAREAARGVKSAAAQGSGETHAA